jgi:ABC-2 type transport system ATP-binding protein
VELIQLKGVTKEYKTNKVLENVNLSIKEGDIFGIIGQSGSGKSTLLSLMAGLLRPSNGDVLYYSKLSQQPKSLHRNFKKIKQYIGFTPQHFSFYPKLTVKENLFHFGALHGMQKTKILANAKNLLEFTELYEDRNKLAEHLSGGMQKRLDISCSLIHRPKILFLDEPTADLDPVMQEDIIHLIQEVNSQGITVIISSHHLESLERICDKIAIIHNGRIHSTGDVESIRKPFLKEHLTINIKTGQDKERILALASRLPINKIIDQGDRLVLFPENASTAVNSLLQAVQEEQLYLHDIDLRKPSFNEIFERIVKK